jgi:hypothetical protein
MANRSDNAGGNDMAIIIRNEKEWRQKSCRELWKYKSKISLPQIALHRY